MAPSKAGEKAAKKKKKKAHSLIGFQAGHHCIVSGASGRGKTWYVVDAILGTGVHAGLGSPWDAVVILCDGISIKQPAFQRLKKEFTGAGGVTLIEGLPRPREKPMPSRSEGKRQEMEEGAMNVEPASDVEEDEDEGITEDDFMGLLERNFNNQWRTILVIDDLMMASKSGPAERFVDKLFTSARHLWVDVWELTQTHTGSRTRRLQTGYLVNFATPADVKSLAHICNSIKPETKGHDILQAYRTATESHNGHGCLVMCMQQPNKYMFRNTDMRVCFDLGEAPLQHHAMTLDKIPHNQ